MWGWRYTPDRLREYAPYYFCSSCAHLAPRLWWYPRGVGVFSPPFPPFSLLLAGFTFPAHPPSGYIYLDDSLISSKFYCYIPVCCVRFSFATPFISLVPYSLVCSYMCLFSLKYILLFSCTFCIICAFHGTLLCELGPMVILLAL